MQSGHQTVNGVVVASNCTDQFAAGKLLFYSLCRMRQGIFCNNEFTRQIDERLDFRLAHAKHPFGKPLCGVGRSKIWLVDFLGNRRSREAIKRN